MGVGVAGSMAGISAAVDCVIYHCIGTAGCGPLCVLFTYGKKDPYSKLVKSLFANRQWRLLWYTIDKGHKYNTNLATHNYFTILFLTGLSALAYFFEWQSAVVFLGAMVLHYVFDIVDDFLILGSINPNWKRWGRGR